MKISREIIINGASQNVEYELTGIERERVYNEYVFDHNKNDILSQMREQGYEAFDEVPEDLLEEMATTVAKKMLEARDEITLNVIRENEENLAEYKTKWKVFSAKVSQTKERYYTIKARDEREAENLLANYLENEYDRANDDFEYKDAEYETLFIDEDNYADADDADIKGDE